MQGDGRIVVAGSVRLTSVQGGIGVVRLTPDGSPDGSFDADGLVVVDLGFQASPQSISALADGRILVGGARLSETQGMDLAMVRLLPSGALDPTFGSQGVASVSAPDASEQGGWILVQPDGKLVIAGFAVETGSDFLLERFHADGTLDVSFGASGFLRTDFGGQDEPAGIALAGADLIVLAGYTVASADHDFALARYIAATPVELLTFGVE